MSLSTYEQERVARISQNQKLMNSLGLGAQQEVLPRSQPNSGPKSKRRLKSENDDILPPRRSMRSNNAENLMSLPGNWREPEDEKGTRPKRRARNAEADDSGREVQVKTESVPTQREQKKAPRSCTRDAGPADSSRNLVAEIALLQTVLGERIPGGHVKAAVMNFASPKIVPRFSKYVGVQEWVNAVFLMFNVVAGNPYGNSFIKTKTGMQVTYFLSERTSPESPIVGRLQRVTRTAMQLGEPATVLQCGVKLETQAVDGAGSMVHSEPAPFMGTKQQQQTQEGAFKDEECDTQNGSETVAAARDSIHLFCRPAPESYKQLGLPHADYVYLGRLGFVGCDVGQVPIKFVFELLDFPALSSSSEFQALLSLAKA